MTSVLAGPLARRVEASQLILWLALDGPIDPRSLRAEVFDPLPEGLSGWVKEAAPSMPLGILGDVRFVDLSSKLRLVLLIVRPFARAFPPERALAYRVSLDAGVSWLAPPASAHELPGPQWPARKKGAPEPPKDAKFPYAWVVVPAGNSRWTTLSVMAKHHALVQDADVYVARAEQPLGVARPGSPNPEGRYVSADRPSSITFFGIDEVPPLPDDFVKPLLARLGGENVGSDDPIRYAAMMLCALAPNLLRDYVRVFDDPVWTVAIDAASARARLAAHIPSCLLATKYDRGEHWTRAYLACLAWGTEGAGNFGEMTRAGPEIDLLGPKSIALRGEVTPDARLNGGPDLAVLVAQKPVLDDTGRLLLQRPISAALQYDWTFIIAPHPALGFVVATDTILKLTATRDATDGDGLKYARLLQIAIPATDAEADEAANERPPSPPVTPPPPQSDGTIIQWIGNHYAPGASTPQRVDRSAFVVVTRDRADVRIDLMTGANEGIRQGLRLRSSGRIVRMATGDPGAVYIGNRFASDPASAKHDGDHFEGVQVRLGTGSPVVTAADGLVPSTILDNVEPGEYQLVIDVSDVAIAPQPGPDIPTRAQLRAKIQRVWRSRTFDVRVEVTRVNKTPRSVIVEVDGEHVDPKQGVRLLLDPAYMALVSGTALKQTSSKVNFVVIHRTEGADAKSSAGKWMLPLSKRDQIDVKHKDGTVTKEHDNTAAHYLLARDGTLIKLADEGVNVNHAGGPNSSWRSSTPNLNAVGIEISKLHFNLEPYKSAQYDALIALLTELVTSTRSDIAIGRSDIIGHDEVNVGHHDDPGLQFEWARLEVADLSFRRPTPWTPLVNPLPVYAPNFGTKPSTPSNDRKRSVPTLEWQQQVDADLKKFDVLFPNATRAALVKKIDDLLLFMGYSATIKAEERREGFRTHVFSGARRTLFGYRKSPREWNLEEEDDGTRDVKDSTTISTQLKLTAVWAREVADFMASERGVAKVPT